MSRSHSDNVYIYATTRQTYILVSMRFLFVWERYKSNQTVGYTAKPSDIPSKVNKVMYIIGRMVYQSEAHVHVLGPVVQCCNSISDDFTRVLPINFYYHNLIGRH